MKGSVIDQAQHGVHSYFWLNDKATFTIGKHRPRQTHLQHNLFYLLRERLIENVGYINP